MVLGISLANVFLSHVYICPGGATCHNFLEPTSDLIQNLRTAMQYWLQVGMLLFGVGLARLASYQAWLAMRRQGRTIDILDLNFTTLHGSAWNAAKLFLVKRQNRSVATFMLILIGITTSISLVVGKSFSAVLPDTGSTTRAQFTYTANVSLQLIDYFSGTLIQDWIRQELRFGGWSSKYPGWDDAFRGTLIMRDNRTVYAANARPMGLRIGSGVSCVDPGANISVVEIGPTAIPGVANYEYARAGRPNLTITVMPPDSLLVAMAGTDSLSKSTRGLIWVSNQAGVIPHAAQTPDGKMYIGVCTLSLNTFNISSAGQEAQGVDIQNIQPTNVCGSFCDSSDDYYHWVSNDLPDLLYTQLFFWLGFDSSENISAAQVLPVACESGIWSRYGTTGQGCHISNETWSGTVDALIQGLLQTLPRTLNATQDLMVREESISRKRWWFQGVIPLCALLLYVVCLMYTLWDHRPEEVTLTELNALELMTAAAQVGDIQVFEQTGGLTGSLLVGGNGVSGAAIKEGDA